MSLSWIGCWSCIEWFYFETFVILEIHICRLFAFIFWSLKETLPLKGLLWCSRLSHGSYLGAPVNLSVAIVNHAHLHRKVWHRVNHSASWHLCIHRAASKVALCLSSFWQPWLSTSSYMQTSFSHKGFHFIVVAEMRVAFQWKPFPLIIDFDHISQKYISRVYMSKRHQEQVSVTRKGGEQIYSSTHVEIIHCWKKCRLYLPLIHFQLY